MPTKLSPPLSRALLGLRIGAWVFAYALFSTMLAAGNAMRQDTPAFLLMLLLVGIALSGVTEAAVKRSNSMSMMPRLFLVSLVVALITAVNAAIDVTTLGRSLAPDSVHDLRFYVLSGVQSITFLIWIHAFYAACVWLAGASVDLMENRTRLAEAETAAQRASLAALRSQINPHFLFNTLNSAASLIATQHNKQAEDLILGLSEFFRSSLSIDRPTTISLGEELDIIDSYLQIELVRFPGRLDVSIDCPPSLANAEVPSFLLLPVVENVIKHAVSNTAALVHLKIFALSQHGLLRVVVEDEAADAIEARARPGEGMGLSNVRERLNVIYGGVATLEANGSARGFRVCIELPLIGADAR